MEPIHRYASYIRHRSNQISWLCSCGDEGATRFELFDSMKRDYLLHQQAVPDAVACDECTAVTTEPYEYPTAATIRVPDGLLCLDCHNEFDPLMARW